MRRSIPTALLLLCLTGASPLMGQEDAFDDMPPQRRERIEALRIWKMTEFLQLTAQQSETFFPRLREMETQIQAERQKQRRILHRIQTLIDSPATKITKSEVQKLAGEIAATEHAIIQRKEKFISETDKILTPEQQLRYLLFETQFRNRLARLLNAPPEDSQPPFRQRRNR